MNVNVKDTWDAIFLTKNISYVDGVKLDIFMSKDGILVTAIDNDLSKYTLSKKKINEEDYTYLRKVKFPSHIFKYYIPKLEDILKEYDVKKIIVLELYKQNNNEQYLNELLNILLKYTYKYYFLLDENFFFEVNNYSFFNKDNILFKNNVKYINNNSSLEGIKKEDLIITDCPKKVYDYLSFSTK